MKLFINGNPETVDGSDLSVVDLLKVRNVESPEITTLRDYELKACAIAAGQNA
jgi:hypothetical protein